MSDALWPYLVVLAAGFLPNEAFRVAGVVLARGIDTNSELFVWIRYVAATLLAALVSKLLFAPPAALAVVPAIWRFTTPLVGIAVFYLTGRRLLAGIVAGEGWLIASAWWAAAPP